MTTWPVEIYTGAGLCLGVTLIQRQIKNTGIKIKIKRKFVVQLRRMTKINALRIAAVTLVTLFFLSASLNIVYDASSYRFNQFETQVPLNSTLTKDDYSLMIWMRSNIPKNDIIFVSSADAGDFIPVIAQRMIVYPWGYNQESPLYQHTLNGLVINPNNETLIENLYALNVTYIYVGAKSYSPYNVDLLDESKFLNSSYYTLVAQSGAASLFKVRYS
jgi:hypothetical protein